MNTVELNNYIKNIALQIPIVHSFSTKSVYEAWNNPGDVKYGSVVFGIKNADAQESGTVYSAIIYYGDRLTNDRSNIESVQSDAVEVLHSIIGSIDLGEELIDVDQPVKINLFEQKFADELAGAYAEITLTCFGSGSCGYSTGCSCPTDTTLSKINNSLEFILYGCDAPCGELERTIVTEDELIEINNRLKNILYECNN